MESNIALLPFLEEVVNRNTQHYQSDFLYDVERLKEAVQETNMENRIFYWMSRPNGTWCVLERDAFLHDSDGHHIWTYYADTPKGIEAYRITVTGQRDGEPVGRVVKLHYPAQVRRVMQNALPVSFVEVTFQSGTKISMLLETHKKDQDCFIRQHGEIVHFRYCPESEAELARRIMVEHRQQTGKVKRRKSKPPMLPPGR